MRFFAAFLLFSLLFSMPSAADNESTPPVPPVGGETALVKLVFTNGSSAAFSPIVLLVRNGNSDTIYRLITDSSGGILLQLGNGEYELDALLDDPSTPGIDYAATTTLSSLGSSTLILYPAGSISGKVTSDGSPVAGARVHASCPSSSFDYARINGESTMLAGEAGDFLFRALPTGTCSFSASSGAYAGSNEATIEHGKVALATVEMRPKAQEGLDFGLVLVAAIAAIIILAIAFRAFGMPKPRQEGKQEAKHARNAIKTKESKRAKQMVGEKPSQKQAEDAPRFDAASPKAAAVLATLSEREAEIVRFLFKCNGRAKRFSIQHKLLIPKTSLLRNLRSLERKRIVKLTPFGRNLLAEVESPLFE